jgi:hypothetical protein
MPKYEIRISNDQNFGSTGTGVVNHPPFRQLFVVLQVVMPILNIDIFLLFIPLLNR